MVGGPDSAAAGPGRGDLRASHADREQVIATLKTAFMQGRLTSGELGERAGQVYAARTYAELAEVTADLPAGIAARLPAVRDVRLAVGLILAAVSVLAAIVALQPDNALAFLAAIAAAATILVVPGVTVGLLIDVLHQRRSDRRRSR